MLADSGEGPPELILLASGSEVALCVEVYERLVRRGIRARVVSLPCWELFDTQPREYREAVLPPHVARRIAVEAASPLGWERYVGCRGRIVALDRFGASAPYPVIAERLGFTPDRLERLSLELLEET